jgi:flagellar hook protein FlgE
MLTAFSTALSTLDANEMGIDVAGNNLANLSTPGYKATTLDFSEAMAQTSADGTTQLGMGVAMPTTSRDSTEGALVPNSGPLTAAIQGDGYFMVQDATGNVLYTRDGNFQLDAQGNLLSQSGEQVLGVNGPIQVPSTNLAPTATTAMTIDLNLDAGAAAGTTFSQPIQVVDSLGATHTVTITFTKSAAPAVNTWTYNATSDAGGASVTTVTGGTLTFNADGTLNTPAPSAGTPPVNSTIAITGLPNGAQNMSIGWDFYANDNATGLITQDAGTSASSAQYQNGSVAASLSGVSIGDGGFVVATYDNGKTVNVGQLQVATFRNPDSLIDVGNNEYAVGGYTSAPSIGVAGTGGRGTVVGGSLEGSNVDIATEFSNLIVFQRGYEAGTRVITTADQLTEDTINLIRE